MNQGYGVGELLVAIIRIPLMILAGIAAFCLGFMSTPKKRRTW